MSQITAEMIKELRERTGVGMAKCKEALEKASGNLELAIDNLRKAGMASAVKKEGRETKEGAITVGENNEALVLLEVNAETDFVVKNEKFQQFLEEMAKEALLLKAPTMDAFLSGKFSKKPAETIEQQRAHLVSSLGENIKITRMQRFEKQKDATIGTYAHMGGKIVTLVEIVGSAGEEALAKDIAMHIAAEDPQYLSEQEVPDSVKAHEREIAKAQVVGKPENVVAKIVEGKVNAFYDASCLLRQKFIKDQSLNIAQLVDKRSKETGKKLSVKRFVRWRVGEGA